MKQHKHACIHAFFVFPAEAQSRGIKSHHRTLSFWLVSKLTNLRTGWRRCRGIGTWNRGLVTHQGIRSHPTLSSWLVSRLTNLRRGIGRLTTRTRWRGCRGIGTWNRGLITRGIRLHHTLSFLLISRLTNFRRGFEELTTRTGWRGDGVGDGRGQRAYNTGD